MKTTVYIETTIISYLTADPSRDLVVAAHQQTTHEWWHSMLSVVECVVSPFVIDEASRGDSVLAEQRLKAIAGFRVLDVNNEIQQLAERYVAALQIPERSKLDAFHLAVASWHRIDYVLSWNCKHIASGRMQKMLQHINTGTDIHTPIV